MKSISELIYKAYQNKRENKIYQRSKKFDKLEEEFVSTLSEKQKDIYYQIEDCFFETIENCEIEVIEYLLTLIVAEEII